MSLVSFVKWRFLLILCLVFACTCDGFRLIQSPKKETPHDDQKHAEKSPVFKDDVQNSVREKYTNQSIKIESKRFQTPKKISDEKESVVSKIDKNFKSPQLSDSVTKQNISKAIKQDKAPVERKTSVPAKTNPPDVVEVKPKQLVKTPAQAERTDEIKLASIKETKLKDDLPKLKKQNITVTKQKEEILKPVLPKQPDQKETPKPDKKETPKETEKKETPKIPEKKETPKQPEKKETPKQPDKKETPKQPVNKDTPKQPKEQPEKLKPKITTPEKTVTKIHKSNVKTSQEIRVKEEVKPTQKLTDHKVTKELRYNLPSFFLNFGSSPNEECRKQGQIFLDNFKNNKLWAMRMFDSSAKIPSGILKGNLNQLGDFDQCLDIFTKIPDAIKNDTEVKIAGKYCLALIDVRATKQEMKLPVNLAQGRALIRSKLQDPGHFIPRFTTLQWGLCVPSGCTADDAEEVLKNALQIYNGTHFDGIKLDVSVQPEDCTVQKSSNKLKYDDIFTFMTICILISSVVIAFISTLCDMRSSNETNHESSTMEKIFMSFSLKRTTKTLFRWDSEKDEIKCIHGIRTICTLLLYLGHKLIPLGHTPFTNRVELTELANNVFSVILRMSIIYTDSFLLLSGVLISYHMSKDMSTKGYIPWFNRIFSRFIRLAPTLFVVLLYYAYLMDHVNDGPLWNTVITTNSNLCKDNWWKNLLFIQNLYPFEEMCATHTHQLALDMQLFLFTPVLVWFLYRKPILGIGITVLMHILSVLLRYYTTLNYRLSIVIYHGISISQLYRTANLMYASTLHRATPYIAGVSLGVLLHQVKPNTHIPKIVSIIGWIVSIYFGIWTLYAPSHLASRSYKYDVYEAAQFAALSSVSWSLVLSWIIFASRTNGEGYLNTFLSSYPMVLLSRLSYTTYLVQFIVFFYKVGVIRTPTEFDPIKSVDLSELTIVIVASILLTLLIDLPVQTIKSVLMSSAPVKKVVDTEIIAEDVDKGDVVKGEEKIADVEKIADEEIADVEKIADEEIDDVEEIDDIEEIEDIYDMKGVEYSDEEKSVSDN